MQQKNDVNIGTLGTQVKLTLLSYGVTDVLASPLVNKIEYFWSKTAHTWAH